MVAGPARTLLSVVLVVAHRPVFVSARRLLDLSTDPTQDKALPPLLPPTFVLDADCRNSCRLNANNGYCDDGGYGSEYDRCELGTDCDDCGPRRYLPPPPLPPLPPPLPPRPTYFVTNNKDFRQRWREVVQAATDAVIEIASGSHFRLSTQLVCAKDIRLTVFSSGHGATLDGMHKSRLFQVRGCSLTLRGLNLVNGMVPAGLKQECRDQTSGEWNTVGNGSIWVNADVTVPACRDNVRPVLPMHRAHPDHAHPSNSPTPPPLRKGVPSLSRRWVLSLVNFFLTHQTSQTAQPSRCRWCQHTGRLYKAAHPACPAQGGGIALISGRKSTIDLVQSGIFGCIAENQVYPAILPHLGAADHSRYGV